MLNSPDPARTPRNGDMRTAPGSPRWARGWLIAAAIYNIVWGAFIVLSPTTLFDWCEMAQPRYVGIWQCVGMIVGVYGVGYAIAATDPLRHWPIVLVGLLGKIFGPIGFVSSAIAGELPWQFGWTILSNDLIWWPAFGAILWRACQQHRAKASPPLPRE